MSPQLLTATLIMLTVLLTSVLFWAIWLNHRLKEKALNQAVVLSVLEKDKIQILQKALKTTPKDPNAITPSEPI